MTNFKTSRYNNYKPKYYTDINVKTKRWEVVELPTRHIVDTFTFKEDASKMVSNLNTLKPFGEMPLPRFLIKE